MKLFGPNSETALIAEDDDRGIDTNALIAAEISSPVSYFVQVRHYNRANGMGNYPTKSSASKPSLAVSLTALSLTRLLNLAGNASD